jgi:glycine betaine/proline transport system substrate-binding protein
VSIFYPNWSEGVAFTHLKVALESDGYDVTLTNPAPGLIYGELSKDDSRVMCFLMHGFRTRTKITGRTMVKTW